MIFEYIPKGTCSRKMIFDINDEKIIQSLEVIGGCAGNLAGISKMLIGMPLDFVIERFEGVRCGNKPTSCPDQIARALKEYSNK